MAEKKEVLVGGLGDKKPDSSFSSKSIQQGVSVEKEHSKNPKVRKEIAKDHLTEEPAYYDKLKQMENTPSFPGLDKLLNGFIEDNEQFLFGKDFGKGGGKSNYYQKPGITHISAEFRMTGQPKKADSVDLSEWFVDDEQAKSAGWFDKTYPVTYDAVAANYPDKLTPEQKKMLESHASENLQELGSLNYLGQEGVANPAVQNMIQNTKTPLQTSLLTTSLSEIPETKRRMLGLLPPKVPVQFPAQFHVSDIGDMNIHSATSGTENFNKPDVDQVINTLREWVKQKYLSQSMDHLNRQDDMLYQPDASRPRVVHVNKAASAQPRLSLFQLCKQAVQAKKADWTTDLKNTAWRTAGNIANQFEPSQFGRAMNTYGSSRKAGDGYLEAARAAHGQLSDPVRGLTGGGAGLLAGALLPAGVRGWAMPAAGGVGAAMAMANGPNGFEWKNMLTPKALAAGGLGALAGYLGNQAMGGDEEEETTDLLGRPVKRRSSGSNWLLPALGIGAAGLGGYALYNHLNPGQISPAQSAAQSAVRGAGQGLAGVGNTIAAQSAGSNMGKSIAGLGGAVGRAVSGLTTSAAPPVNPAASAANLAGYGLNQAAAQGIPAIGNAARAWANSGTPKPPAPTSSLLTPAQQGMVDSAVSAPAPKAPPAVNIPPAVSQGMSAARSMAGNVPSIPVAAIRGASGAGAAAGRAAGGMMGRVPSGPVSLPSVPNVIPSIAGGLAGVRNALVNTSSLSGMGNALRDTATGIKSMVTNPSPIKAELNRIQARPMPPLPAGIDKILARPNPTIPTAADLMKRPPAPTFIPPKPFVPPTNPTFTPPRPALPPTGVATPLGQVKQSSPVPSTAAKPSLALNEQGPLAPNQRRGDYSLGNQGVRIWNGNNGPAPVPKQGKYYPATYDSAYLMAGKKQDKALNKLLGEKVPQVAFDAAAGVNDEGADVAMFNALREGQSPEQFNRKYRDKSIVAPGRVTIPETKRRLLGLLPPKIRLTAPSNFVDFSQVTSPEKDRLISTRQSSGIVPASLSESDRARLMALVDDLYMGRTANLAFGDYKPSPIPELDPAGRIKRSSIPGFVPLTAEEQIAREKKKRELATRERSLTPYALAGAGAGWLGSRLYRAYDASASKGQPNIPQTSEPWWKEELRKKREELDEINRFNKSPSHEYAHDSGFALDSVANPPPVATWKDTPMMDLGPAFLP